MLTKTRDVVENICMPPKLPQHIRQMDANGPYHHISTSRPIKQAPPKNVTKSLMCCMFPSPENLPYRHLYLDGIAWQWGGKPFNTGVARETPKMSSKTSNPLKIWGEAGEHQKKNTHTKKTIDWGKKKEHGRNTNKNRDLLDLSICGTGGDAQNRIGWVLQRSWCVTWTNLFPLRGRCCCIG